MDKVKILVVDDNENNRYTLRRRLKRLGYDDITEAEHGQHALDIVTEQPHDIILLDVMMPVMDGFEVLAHIKNDAKLANTAVIMISALDDLDNVIKSIELGADDYLPKPFNPTLLAARLKAAVRKRKLISLETNYYKDFDKATDFAKLELFTGSLKNEMSLEIDTSFSVVYIQFTHYNYISQTINLDAANDYLTLQSNRLKIIFKHDQITFGRIADDVIAVFGQSKSISALNHNESLPQQLLHPLQQSIEIENETIQGGIGIGISMSKARNKKTSALISNAAFASQTALDSETGLAFYDPELHQQNIDKFRLEPKLRDAIKNQKLVLHYQPIVNANTEQIETFEALIRWIDDEGNYISPFKFITLAEETGLIFDIDDFVLDETCRQIAHWIKKYGKERKFTIGANISAKHWVNPDLLNKVKTALITHQIPSHYLKLEMTESALVDNAKIVKDIVMGLKALGVKVALDDFGTGYSSLGYLLEFPVDILKIDKVFIDDIETIDRKKQLLNHILSITKSLNMVSIAEGVESQLQADILKQYNCEQIQGFHFYKPMLPIDVEKIY